MKSFAYVTISASENRFSIAYTQKARREDKDTSTTNNILTIISKEIQYNFGYVYNYKLISKTSNEHCSQCIKLSTSHTYILHPII